MSTLAHTPSSSKKRSLKEEKPLPPLASTLDVVQFDPGNVLHSGKAPRLFLSLQRHFADPALASKADVYMFADECIFVGAVVHDSLAWSREGGQPEEDNNMDLDVDPQNIAPKHNRFVGFFYIHPSTSSGEMNIGLILDTNFNDRSCEYFVLHKALNVVFNNFNCHRAQVAVIEDGKNSMKIRELLISVGFALEGTKRMSVFSPSHSSWRDVTYFAMLDTEWLFKRFDPLGIPLNPKNTWDEMWDRYKREQEELLGPEERLGRALKRTSSSETIRVTMTECGAATDTSSINCGESDRASLSGESHRRGSVSSRPGPPEIDFEAAVRIHRMAKGRRMTSNPFVSDLDGAESTSSRQTPFEDASVDGRISWASVQAGSNPQILCAASVGTPPPFSSYGTVSSGHSNSDERAVDDYRDDFALYADNDGTADSRALLKKMMEDSLSSQVAVAGPSKVRDWLDSNFTADASASDPEPPQRDPSAARSATGNSDGGEATIDSDHGVILDGSMEKDEPNDDWEVLSNEG